MTDQLLLNLTKLFYLIEKWNKHEFDNEELFLDDVKPVIKVINKELESCKKSE